MARTDVVSLPLSICIFKALMFLKHPSVGANSDMCYGGKSLQLQPCWTTYISGFGLTGLVKVQLFFLFLYSWRHWSSHVRNQLCWKMKGKECLCSSDCAVQCAKYYVCATNMNFLRGKKWLSLDSIMTAFYLKDVEPPSLWVRKGTMLTCLG